MAATFDQYDRSRWVWQKIPMFWFIRQSSMSCVYIYIYMRHLKLRLQFASCRRAVVSRLLFQSHDIIFFSSRCDFISSFCALDKSSLVRATWRIRIICFSKYRPHGWRPRKTAIFYTFFKWPSNLPETFVFLLFSQTVNWGFIRLPYDFRKEKIISYK